MSDIQNKIQEEAKKALESGEVGLVIGYGAGSVPFKTTPVFVEKPEDVDKLVWNTACVNNLAVYLPKLARDRKVAVVAKPCDIRSIVTLIREKQLKRENVFIIGINCGAVIDAAKLANPSETTELPDVPPAELLREQCKVCDSRTPAISARRTVSSAPSKPAMIRPVCSEGGPEPAPRKRSGGGSSRSRKKTSDIR